MHEPPPIQAPVLVVSTRLSDRRRHALARLVGGRDLVVADPGKPLPDLDAFAAVVVDGPPPAHSSDDLARLGARVAAGAALLGLGASPREAGGFWSDLLGTTDGPPAPSAEYFAKVSGDHPLADRVAAEFPVVDALQPLRPSSGATTLVTVNVGFRDQVAVTERRLGEGSVTVSGLGGSDEALANPDLATLLRRALSTPARRCCGRSIGLGVLGYGPFGGMGYHHGTAAQDTEGLEFVAVCDESPERRKAAEKDFPGVRTYASATELADDDDVEVVVVATPPAFHTELCLSMLRAGKHVACEKPLCLTVEHADLLLDAARDARRVLTVHQNRRWDPDYVAVRRAVDQGLLGELFNVETFVGGFEHPCRAWHSEVSLSGGAVYDWGSHHIDWILQLVGSAPATVRAHGHKRVWHDVTNLDQLRVRMLWDDGREGEFLQSDVAAVRRPKFYLQGTAATLVGQYRPVTFERLEPGRGYVAETAHHAEAPAALTLARYESGYGISETRLPVAGEQRFAFHRNLADHLHLGEPLAVDAAEMRQVVAVLEAAQRSSDEGGAEIALASTR